MGGHGGGGPWGVAEDVARTGHGGDGPWGSQRRWPVGGRGGGGPVQGHEEVVRAGRRRRWSVQVAEEVVRAGGGGELIQKFRILQVFLVFSLMKILYIDIKQKSPVKF